MSEPKGRATLLTELKAYTKRQKGNALTLLLASYLETDRGTVILLATSLEDAIQDAIQHRFVDLNSDEKSRIFGPDAPLGSFSAKLRIAHALGLLNRKEMMQIDLLREARNACAHNRGPISLKTPQLSAVIDLFVKSEGDWIAKHEDPKIRIALTVAYFAYRLTGMDPTAASRRLLETLIEEHEIARPPSPEKSG
jgi:hypothetical protein